MLVHSRFRVLPRVRMERKATVTHLLFYKDSHKYKNKCTIDRRPCNELQEKFETCFRNDASNPKWKYSVRICFK